MVESAFPWSVPAKDARSLVLPELPHHDGLPIHRNAIGHAVEQPWSGERLGRRARKRPHAFAVRPDSIRSPPPSKREHAKHPHRDRHRLRTFAVEYWEDLHPYAAGGAYVNFLMDAATERVRATYGENYVRLQEIKSRYDPTNLFQVNQNIPPTA